MKLELVGYWSAAGGGAPGVRCQQLLTRGSPEKAPSAAAAGTKRNGKSSCVSLSSVNSALSKHLHFLTLSLHVKNSVSSSRICAVSRNWLCSPKYLTKFCHWSLLGTGNPNDFLDSNHGMNFQN